MNNFLRTVIELLSCKEHDKIKPAEDILEVSLTLSSISDYYQALEKNKKAIPGTSQATIRKRGPIRAKMPVNRIRIRKQG